MADQKYTGDPLISAGDQGALVWPVAISNLDKKMGWAQVWVNPFNSYSAFTPGSVPFMSTSGLPNEDNSNFFYNGLSHILSVGVGGDFTGTDSINVYKEVDAFLPQSSQGAIGSGAESGFTASTARGTGVSPAIVNTGDLAGGFSGWGYTGASPSYQALGGMWIKASGATANNLGGIIEFWTKADGGALTKAMTINNGTSGTIYVVSTGGFQSNNNNVLPSIFATIAGGSNIQLSSTNCNIFSTTSGSTTGGVSFSLAKGLSITQGALSSSWVPTLRFDPGAHTNLTSATEFPDYVFSGSAHTWVAGTIATQRFFWIKSSSVVTGTATDCYQFYVDAPTGNITNAWAAGFNGNVRTFGKTTADSDYILTNAAKGLVLKDTQASPHYWRVTVNNSGVLVISDLGTTQP